MGWSLGGDTDNDFLLGVGVRAFWFSSLPTLYAGGGSLVPLRIPKLARNKFQCSRLASQLVAPVAEMERD